MQACVEKIDVMFHFQLIKWRLHPKTNRYYTEWFLVTSNFETFEEFLRQRSGTLMKEYWKIKKKLRDTGGKIDHCTSHDERMVEFTLLYGRQDDRLTIVDDCNRISDKLLGSYTHYFFDKGMIFITENGAIRPLVDCEHEVLRSKESDVLVWPRSDKYTKADIDIKKWPGGKHYYAEIGNIKVESKDGKQRWNTVVEAERQAGLFLRRINKKG